MFCNFVSGNSSHVPNPAVASKQLHPTAAPQTKLWQTDMVRPLYRLPYFYALHSSSM